MTCSLLLTALNIKLLRWPTKILKTQNTYHSIQIFWIYPIFKKFNISHLFQIIMNGNECTQCSIISCSRLKRNKSTACSSRIMYNNSSRRPRHFSAFYFLLPLKQIHTFKSRQAELVLPICRRRPLPMTFSKGSTRYSISAVVEKMRPVLWTAMNTARWNFIP